MVTMIAIQVDIHKYISFIALAQFEYFRMYLTANVKQILPSMAFFILVAYLFSLDDVASQTPVNHTIRSIIELLLIELSTYL